MPRKVIAWVCAWGCGCKVTTKRASMVKHEERCFHNPARRACASCAHFEGWDTVNCGDGNLHNYVLCTPKAFPDKMQHDCDAYQPKQGPLEMAIEYARRNHVLL